MGAKVAAAAQKQAEARADKAESRARKVALELEKTRDKLESPLHTPTYRQLERELQERSNELAAEQARVAELQHGRIAKGMEVSKLRGQLAAQQQIEERAVGSPRQLQLEADAAKSAREEAERKMRECREMMRDAAATAAAAARAAAAKLAAAQALRPTSPASVIEDTPLGRGARGGTNVPSIAKQGAGLHVRVRSLHKESATPYDPAICELLRRLVSEANIAKHNVAAALAIAYTIHTGEIPDEVNLVNTALIDAVFDQLGALDQEKAAEVNKARKHGVAIAGDTGNRKHCAQYKAQWRRWCHACGWRESDPSRNHWRAQIWAATRRRSRDHLRTRPPSTAPVSSASSCCSARRTTLIMRSSECATLSPRVSRQYLHRRSVEQSSRTATATSRSSRSRRRCRWPSQAMRLLIFCACSTR